jgi:hypothetical protein
MAKQGEQAADAGAGLRAAIGHLLEEDLDDRQLAERLRALLPPESSEGSPPTTDDATDHPGYQ